MCRPPPPRRRACWRRGSHRDRARRKKVWVRFGRSARASALGASPRPHGGASTAVARVTSGWLPRGRARGGASPWPHGRASARRHAGDLWPATTRASACGAAPAPPRRLHRRAANLRPAAKQASARATSVPSSSLSPPRRVGPPLPSQEDCIAGERGRIFAVWLSLYPK